MRAMTYSEEFLGTAAAGRKLSSGPFASDGSPKFEHAVTSFQRPGPDVLSAAIGFVSRAVGLHSAFWMLAALLCLVPLTARLVAGPRNG